MRRMLAWIISILMVLSLCTIAWAEDDISVEINGTLLEFDVEPAIVNGRTMLPLRGIFEALGLTVGWDAVTRTITGTADGTTVVLTIDNPVAMVNGKAVTLDVPAMIMNGRTVVPTRFVAEATGADVGWNGVRRTVSISGGYDNNKNPKNEPEAITIGLVASGPVLSEDTFAQLAWDGIQRFATDYNLGINDYAYLASESDGVYESNLMTMVEAGKDLIVAPGFMLVNSVNQVASMYPEQKILVLDAAADGQSVLNASFAEEEGAFLAGVAAALKAQSQERNIVGFIGGMDFELIQKFEAGYEAGVHAVDPTMTVLVEYVNSFSDPALGNDLGAWMYDNQAYVIFHAAGTAGNGLIEAAKTKVSEGGDVWVIGVDVDQYESGIYDGNQSVILTSMIKRLDEVTYQVAVSVKENTFYGGGIQYGLKENGVGLPDVNPNLTNEMITIINTYKNQIINGEIVVPTVPNRLTE